MSVEYCSVAHVYQQAAPYGSLDVPAREVASVDTTANTLEIAGHGCALNDAIQFRAFPGGTLPSPLSASSVYRAKPVDGSSSLLQVSATVDGAAIDLTTAGSSFGLCVDVDTKIRGHIRKWSQRVQPFIPANAMPVEPDEDGLYPETLRDTVAILAAWSALASLGRKSEALDTLFANETEWLKKTLAGLPPRDRGLTVSTNLAVGRSPTSSARTDVIP